MDSLAMAIRTVRWAWLLAAVMQVVGMLGDQRLARAADLGTYPAWTTYGLTEALIMGRGNQAANQPLLVEVGNPDNVLLSGNNLQFPFGGGIRAFYGARNPDLNGWEIGYFGLYGQSASSTASLRGDGQFLQVPGPLGDGLTSEAQSATVTWASVINSAEANLFRTSTEWTDPRNAWRTVDWLVGFRYIGVEESATIDMVSCEGAGPVVPYGVHTRNNMFGAQIGTRGRLTWERWALEGWAKAGLLGCAQEQMQDPLVDWLGEPVPDRGTASSTTAGQVGYVGDINLSAVYRLTDVWGIRAGYNTIWIGGAALAPNQFSFAADGRVQSVTQGGGIFLHGVNLGLEARW